VRRLPKIDTDGVDGQFGGIGKWQAQALFGVLRVR
jgi:hypothetical protein